MTMQREQYNWCDWQPPYYLNWSKISKISICDMRHLMSLQLDVLTSTVQLNSLFSNCAHYPPVPVPKRRQLVYSKFTATCDPNEVRQNVCFQTVLIIHQYQCLRGGISFSATEVTLMRVNNLLPNLRVQVFGETSSRPSFLPCLHASSVYSIKFFFS